MKKYLLILSIILLMPGCAGFKELVTVEKTSYVPVSVQPAPQVAPPELDYVAWTIIHSKNAKEKIKSDGDVFYALNPEDVKKLHDNLLNLLQYIDSQAKTILYYEQAIVKSQEDAKKLNEQGESK